MMLQGWRWYGPDDPVSLDDIRQAGATDVVTALHQVPIGEAWTRSAIEERKHIIEKSQPGRSQLTWSVVESIPIPDDVKRLGAKATRSIEAWIASLEAVASAGIKIICYNFMPVVDWCRTDLEWELPNGARAMRFDQDRFAAFDLHILQRPEAAAEYSEAAQARAKQLHAGMTQADIDYLDQGDRQRAAGIDHRTADHSAIPRPAAAVSRHQFSGAAPASGRVSRPRHARGRTLGVTLTLHPDDPPRPLFGLPRIASSVGRLSGAVRCGSFQGERHLLLHRLARGARGKRSAGDGEALCPADRLCAFAGDKTRGRRPVVLRIRSSRRRRRHDRGAEGAARRKPQTLGEATRSCSGRITAIACSTISPRPSAPIPATPRSAGCGG